MNDSKFLISYVLEGNEKTHYILLTFKNQNVSDANFLEYIKLASVETEKMYPTIFIEFEHIIPKDPLAINDLDSLIAHILKDKKFKYAIKFIEKLNCIQNINGRRVLYNLDPKLKNELFKSMEEHLFD